MSLTKGFIILLLSLVAGLNYNYFAKAKSQPAPHVVPQSEFSGHGVVDRVIQLKFIEAQPAKTEEAPSNIKVAVTVPFDFEPELQFKWLLTENVKLVSGSLAGKISHFKAGVPQELDIQVTGFSQIENRQVAFQITGSKDGRKIFADGIVASLKDNTFENIVQNVEKIKAEKNQE